MSDLTKRINDLSPEKVELLMRQLAKKRAAGNPSQISPQPRDSNRFPLSHAQQRLWFLDQLAPGLPTYTVSFALHMVGELHIDALEQSFTAIVRRHEALRTTFVLEDGQPIQVINPPAAVPLPVIDLRNWPMDQRRAQADALIQAEAREPFNLAKGPMIRSKLLRLADAEHVLALSVHHIAFDNESLGIVLRELSQLYPTFLPGADNRLPELPEPPIQYADFAVWEQGSLQGEALATNLNYWKRQVAGAPAVLDLPTDRPRPPVQTTHGAIQSFMVPAKLSAALKSLSQQEGATIFMTLLASFQILLARYTRQTDIIVGTPVANRTRTEVEQVIGLFFNTLPLRTSLGDNPDFRTLLRRVREMTVSAYAHQELPFEKLVQELQLERDLSHTALFQVLFDLYPPDSGPMALPGVAVQWWPDETTVAKFDLNLAMQETPEGLAGSIIYNTDLFDASTIARMAGHFQTLLAGIAADPTRPIANLPLLPDAERTELVVTRNATQAPYPSDQPFHHLFAAQVARMPKAVAVVFGNRTLTYQELDQHSTHLAHQLRARGVGPDTRVALCCQRSLAMLIGLLGIFKAGGAFIPIDPTFPADRMAYILDDAQASLLLTQAALQPRLPEHPTPVLCLEEPALTPPANVQPLEVAVTGANLAYLIYTSGSTGRPKGVLIPHSGLVNYLHWCQQPYTVAAGRGAPVHASIAADAIFPSLFAPLLAGTSVFIMPDDQPLAALAAALQQPTEFSMVKITPSQLEVLTHDLPPADANGWVRTLVVGAEEVRGEVLEWWRAHAPATVLLNEYGPTETVVGCSIYQIPPDRYAAGTVPIGLPIANLTFYVLDQALQPVPIGVPGELYIGGAGVAWGYHRRPALTAEKFIPDPFAAQPGARLYRTGDLVRALADRAGNIEFLGRIDDQVKIRGYRVELGEITTVILEHPAVREVAVLVRAGTGGKQLVAYVVPEAEPPSAAALQEFLKNQLPDYMLPSAFIFLEALPLAPHGKLDRAALPAPASGDVDQAGTFVKPRTYIEQRMVKIWEQVLAINPIGITDNFFVLGGHSLLVVRLMSEIQKQFGRKLPLSTIFQGATVEHLAQVVTAETNAALWSPLVAIQPEGAKRPFFCVHPVGGDVLPYFTLAQHLGNDQPFYGLQAMDLAQIGDRDISIEEMAAQYISALRTVQPQGQYLLGGFSFGGLVAFEMAQQLRRQGETVELLAMFDSHPPATLGSADNITDGLVLAGLAREQAIQVGKELPIVIEDLKQLEPDAQLHLVLKQIKRIDLEFDTDLEWVRRFVQGYRARERVAHIYQPQPYAGRITLFKKMDEDSEILKVDQLRQEHLADDDATYGWSAYVSQPIQIRLVPGYHGTMIIEPYVQIVAQQLKECLEACHARA